jgi:hypothetical protein
LLFNPLLYLAGTHFTASHNKHGDMVADRNVLGDGPAAPELNVVRVSTDREY